jgi:hypothetical protein
MTNSSILQLEFLLPSSFIFQGGRGQGFQQICVRTRRTHTQARKDNLYKPTQKKLLKKKLFKIPQEEEEPKWGKNPKTLQESFQGARKKAPS